MPDAPETPAPVFAIRAFKSALFGTPAADDDGEGERTLQLKNQQDNHERSRSVSLKPPTENSDNSKNSKEAMSPTKLEPDPAQNASTSPTKSILLTPGTASNRRKTVSFGDGVVDNERKRDGSTSKHSKTPPNSSGSISSQWMSGSSDGKNKPRSKLTQTLMDARDKPDSQISKPEQDSSGSVPRTGIDEDTNDDTVNLDEPRSESGKYWKAEFNSYRTKTSNEIKKLIQYRSVAKSYARKKDEEASRLADKLRDEEQKVSEMERHVTHLASTMVGEGSKADREQLVQDLTKQTALALQYKHRVSLLRKLLEKHGVVGTEVDDIEDHVEVDGPSEKTGEPRRNPQALEQANAKFEDQRTELSKLRNLARSSEEKASKLEEENLALKHDLTRTKREMHKFESRRHDKEGKSRQREAKLEGRIKEYRERLKKTSEEHRAKEQELNSAYEEDRYRLAEEIHLLRTKLRNAEHHEASRTQTRYTHRPPVHNDQQDFAHFHHSPSDNETDISDEPPSPSPRSKGRGIHYPHDPAATILESREPAELDDFEAEQELSPTEDIPVEPSLRSRTIANSGAQYRSQPLYRTKTDTEAVLKKQRHIPDNNRHKQKHSETNTSLRNPTNIDDRPQPSVRGRPRSPVKYSLDAITGFSRPGASQPPRRYISISPNTYRKAAITADRMIAAQVRLRKKEMARKAKGEGKEGFFGEY